MKNFWPKSFACACRKQNIQSKTIQHQCTQADVYPLWPAGPPPPAHKPKCARLGRVDCLSVHPSQRVRTSASWTAYPCAQTDVYTLRPARSHICAQEERRTDSGWLDQCVRTAFVRARPMLRLLQEQYLTRGS